MDRQNGTYRALLLTPEAATIDGITRSIGNTVAIKLAEYYPKDQLLVVQATISGDSGSGAWDTVQAYYSGGKMIGTLSSSGNGTYIGKFIQVANNPKEITVTSSLGGRASSPVTEIPQKGK